MEKREISKEVYEKVIKDIPNIIIEMLPESPDKLLKYAKRVKQIRYSNKINEDVKKLMKEKWLSDEEYLKTFYYVMAITFNNKKPVKNPNMYIVAAQTGSGKSNLTAKILRENENCIFVDSDKYKHFRFDAKQIAKDYQVIYPFLTAPDSYDHADNIYQYALENKYNIIKEAAPSLSKGLIGSKLKDIQKNKYTISVHVLAVGKLNSSLSIHERYELQIIHKLKTAKLTGLQRHNESYEALTKNIEEIQDNIDVYVYTRGKKKNNFEPEKIYPNKKYNTAVEAICDARKIDNEITKKEFEGRYELLISQMNLRNAPKEQFKQIEAVYEEEYKK